MDLEKAGRRERSGPAKGRTARTNGEAVALVGVPSSASDSLRATRWMAGNGKAKQEFVRGILE